MTTQFRMMGGSPSNVVNPYNGLDDLKPIQVGRTAHNSVNDTYPGWKGVIDPATLCWRQANRSSADYVDVGSARYMYLGDLAIIYPQAVIPAGL